MEAQFKDAEFKLLNLRKSLQACKVILVTDETDLETLKSHEGFLYIKKNGNYKSIYNNQIHYDTLGNANAKTAKQILSITSKKSQSASKEKAEILQEERPKIKAQPNSITVEIWYHQPLELNRSIFGFASDGHVSLEICDSNRESHYVSFYSSSHPEPALLSELLSVPSYKSAPGLFKQKIDDILSYVDESKYIEHQKITFDSNHFPELNIDKAVTWSKNFKNSPEENNFNFYTNNCSTVSLAGMLAAGFGEIVAPPDTYVVTAQEVFDYAKAVKNTKANNQNLDYYIDKRKILEEKIVELISGDTNSEGIKKMQKLGSRISLSVLQNILTKKEGKGLVKEVKQNYSHSHFFGKGRSKWADEFYKFLRNVNLQDNSNEMITENLKKIEIIIALKINESAEEKEIKRDINKHFKFQR
ncbi:MAG: hypothetical protein H0U70_12530 [Tatlockia sp.]|nr:hypothetical protein [Tatlockia sp.]